MNSLKVIILVCLCLSLTLYCGRPEDQNHTSGKKNLTEKYHPVKLYYENASGEKAISYFHYNADGINDKSYWTTLDSSRYSHNWQTFDQQGNLIRKYREFSDSLISSNIYKYDNSGNLIEESFERSDGIGGTTTYKYNDKGWLLSADCQGLNGWFYGFISYQNDKQGQKLRAIITKDSAEIGAITYTYDETGNLKEEFWDFPDVWNQTFIYDYDLYIDSQPTSYSSANVFITNTAKYQVVKEEYDFNNEQGGPSFYEYDSAGKLLRKIFERSDGFRTETTFEYDSSGLLVMSARSYSSGLTGTFSYEYNGNRRLVKRIFERSDGVAGSELYEYDYKMNLVKAEYQNFDSWLTGTLTFQHDDSGRLVSGFFDGSEFDADLSFSYDVDGNIVKIHWEFTFGKAQTYQFEYQKL